MCPPAGYGPGRYVMLAVTDTGSGMGAETLAHAFEPFFTTKTGNKGTGLGLAVVYGIVKQNGGSSAVESEPGKGTTFRLYFPAAARAIEPDAAEPMQAEPRGRGETVLAVEQKPQVLSVIRHTLEMLG